MGKNKKSPAKRKLPRIKRVKVDVLVSEKDTSRALWKRRKAWQTESEDSNDR